MTQVREDSHDVRVHRCRFVKWSASGIVCVAAHRKWLGVGRADGTVEILEALSLRRVRRVRGRDGLVLESLTWVDDELYGSSASGLIVHVLMTDELKATASGGGAVWQLLTHDDKLAACCEDGSVRFFKKLEYVEVRRVAHSRCVCAVFDGPRLFVGSDDGTIRGEQRVMTLEEGAIVWCLAMSRHLVSGDSRGGVRMWDAALGVELARFARHDADVLCLAVDADRVFASGVDSKICSYGFDGEWVATQAAHRPHLLDVRALILRRDSLVSASLDGKLCVMTADFNGRPKRHYPTIPAMAVSGDYLGALHVDRLDVFKVPDKLWLRVHGRFACFDLRGADLAVSGDDTRLLLADGQHFVLPRALAVKFGPADSLVLAEPDRIAVYRDGTLVSTFAIESPCPHLAVSVAGDVAAGDPVSGAVFVDGRRLPLAPRALAFKPDGTLLIATDNDSVVDANGQPTKHRLKGLVGLDTSEDHVLVYAQNAARLDDIVSTRYRPLLFAGFQTNSDLVVVEHAWDTNLQQAPLARHKFGRS